MGLGRPVWGGLGVTEIFLPQESAPLAKAMIQCAPAGASAEKNGTLLKASAGAASRPVRPGYPQRGPLKNGVSIFWVAALLAGN